MEMATEWTRLPRGGDLWFNAQMIGEVNVLPPARVVCCDLQVHLVSHTLSAPCSSRYIVSGEKHRPIALIPGFKLFRTREMLTDVISLETRWDWDSGHNREKGKGKKKGSTMEILKG